MIWICKRLKRLEKCCFLEVKSLERFFNFIDFLFQLSTEDLDESYKILQLYIDELKTFYDEKSSLNITHTEKLIDLFRTLCADQSLEEISDKD